MSAIKELMDSGSNAVGQYTFLDADTLRDSQDPETTYRLQGFDAPEIMKLKGDGQLSYGTSGGAAATAAITKLASEQGFTNLVKTGETDNFGREIVELRDSAGRNFTTEIYRSGMLDPGKYAKQEDIDAAEVTRIFGKSIGSDNPEWTDAVKKVEQGIEAETYRDNMFKEQAVSELQYAMNPGRYSSAVQFRHGDRSISNKALNPFSDSWEQGWLGVKESSYGMLNMLGETTDSPWLQDIGEAGVERAHTQMRDYGRILTDWKEVDDIGSAFEYVSNNAALSLPYMAITVGATVAAPFTFGASYAAPASIYAGQVWNEMEGENKNAALAVGAGVAQAALDRLGLGLIFKSGVAPTKLLNEAVEKLVAGGATREAAKAQVMNATRLELAGFVGNAAEVASRQIAAKQIFMDFAKKGMISGSGEAVTEGLQEAVGYTAAHTQEGFNFEELNDRVLAGVIAGGALGTSFSVPGTAYNAGAWADVAVRQAPAEAERLSQAGKYAEQEKQAHGRVKSIHELNAETRMRAAGVVNKDIKDRTESYNALRRDKTVSEQIFDAIVSAPALWRGATRNIFTDDIKSRSRAARIAADMFGGGLQKTFSGSSYENAKHHRVSIYRNMVDTPASVYNHFTGGKKATRARKNEISDMIYAKLRGAVDQDGKFNPNLIPDTDPDKPMLVRLQGQLQSLADKMHSDQTAYNPDLGRLNNYLLRYKAFDKKTIADNRPAFIAALMDEFNMSEADASEITSNITDNFDVNDISDALSGFEAAGRPGSHHKRTLDLAERDSFAPFMERDIFANISAAAKSAARYTSYQEYVGNDHEVLNQLLADMEAEGLTEAEVNKIAKQMMDYLAAESGNYKRPKSDAGKKLQKIQRNFMMFTTLAGLPLATISSFVEVALTVRGLTMDQIFGKNKPGAMENLGTELGQTIWSGMNEISAVADRRQLLPAATRGKETLKNLGFYDWEVGAATTTGVQEINPWQQGVYEDFFKWTGLQGWTNFTRAARAAIAGDYIVDKLNIIFDAQGETKTNEVQEAEEALRNIGINIDDMITAYQGGGMFDPNSYDILEQNFREGTFNFINDAVALPQSANRPLIYQDPRFALFTQFQGFIATFTANHIPKLWGEYVKRGTPAMKYNAFAVMATMIMMGFASQYLKDLLKYGQYRDFGPGEHPYLNRSEYVQRGIRASGLLGTGERVLDQFFPLYEERSEGVSDWVFNTTSGESPALGYLKRLGKGTGHLVEGDVGRAAKEGARFIPIAGVFNFFRDAVAEGASNWNFKG